MSFQPLRFTFPSAPINLSESKSPESKSPETKSPESRRYGIISLVLTGIAGFAAGYTVGRYRK
jgi:hypothetical protein